MRCWKAYFLEFENRGGTIIGGALQYSITERSTQLRCLDLFPSNWLKVACRATLRQVLGSWL
jgi:hypothetical protein